MASPDVHRTSTTSCTRPEWGLMVARSGNRGCEQSSTSSKVGIGSIGIIPEVKPEASEEEVIPAEPFGWRKAVHAFRRKSRSRPIIAIAII